MRIGIIITIAVILDQISKGIVRETMIVGQSIPVLGDLLRITYVENPGIAFGINVSNPVLFTILSIFASVGIIAYLVTHWDESMRIKGSLALILGGAIGNLIDRILFQKVVDFVDVGIRNVRWPVFNVADSVVVIGMFILLFSTIFAQNRIKAVSVKGDRESV